MPCSAENAAMKAELREDVLGLMNGRFLYEAHNVTDKWNLPHECASALGFEVCLLRCGMMREDHLVDKWFDKIVKKDPSSVQHYNEQRLVLKMDEEIKKMRSELDKLKVEHANEKRAKSQCSAALEKLKGEHANEKRAKSQCDAALKKLKDEHTNEMRAKKQCISELEKLKGELVNEKRAKSQCSAALEKLKGEHANEMRARSQCLAALKKLEFEHENEMGAKNQCSAELEKLKSELANEARAKSQCSAALEKLKVEHANEMQAKSKCTADLEKLKGEHANETRAKSQCSAALEKLKVEHANEMQAKSQCTADLEKLKGEHASEMRAKNQCIAELEKLKDELANETRAKSQCISGLETLKVEHANETRAKSQCSAALEKLKVEHANEMRVKSQCISELEKLKDELANETRAKNQCIEEVEKLNIEHANEMRVKSQCISELEKLKDELASERRAKSESIAELEDLKAEPENQTHAKNERIAELEQLKVELAEKRRAKTLNSAELTYFSHCSPSVVHVLQNAADLHEALTKEITNPHDAVPTPVLLSIEREAECYRQAARDPKHAHCTASTKVAAFRSLRQKILSCVEKPCVLRNNQMVGGAFENNAMRRIYKSCDRDLPMEGVFFSEHSFTLIDDMATTFCEVIERLRADDANVSEYFRTRGDEEALFVRELVALWDKMQDEKAYRPGELNERVEKAVELLRWFYGNLDRVKSLQLLPIIDAAVSTGTSRRKDHRQRSHEALAVHQAAVERALEMIAALDDFAAGKANAVADVTREIEEQKSHHAAELEQAARLIEDGYRRMLEVIVAQQKDARRLSLCKAEEVASEKIRLTWQATWQAEEELQIRLRELAKDGDVFVGRFHAWYVAAFKEMQHAAQANITQQRMLIVHDTLKVRTLGSVVLEQVIDQKQSTLQSIRVMQEEYARKQEEWRALVNSRAFDEDSASGSGHEGDGCGQEAFFQQRLEADAEREVRAVAKRVLVLEQQVAKLDERHAAIEQLLAAYERDRQTMITMQTEQNEDGTRGRTEEKQECEEGTEKKDNMEEKEEVTEIESDKETEKKDTMEEKREEVAESKNEKETEKVKTEAEEESTGDRSEKEKKQEIEGKDNDGEAKNDEEKVIEWVRSFFPRAPLLVSRMSQNVGPKSQTSSGDDKNNDDTESRASLYTENYIIV